ncbi:MAG: TetR family transcriptional regulator [Planctomycetes bacterium]|nr:TetR family transcriptional regulator [Planctomycetota bacterium]
MSLPDTKERLRTAAEVLFAAKGFRGISVREITDRAGANLAAVNYHFGSKSGLLIEILESHIGELNRLRLARLDELEARARETGEPLQLEEVLEAFLEPAVRRFLAKGGPDYPALLARLHQDPTPELTEALARIFAPVADRFFAVIHPLVPHLDETALLARSMFLKGAMLHILSDGDRLSSALTGGRVRLQDPDRLLSELIRFCAAGYRAPV